MKKKKILKWIESIPPDATLDDIGFIGWQGELMTPEEKAEADRLTAEWIRKHREENKQEVEEISERMKSAVNVS